jgi:hypothetical protein
MQWRDEHPPSRPNQAYDSGSSSLDYPLRFADPQQKFDRMNEKKRRKPPSQALIAALQEKGYTAPIPRKPETKVDLSYLPPWPKTRRRLRQPRNRSSVSSHLAGRTAPSEPTLQSILAKYITFAIPYSNQQASDQTIQPVLDLSKILNETELKFLNNHGYNAWSLLSWAQIITSKSPDDAVLKLMAISNLSDSDSNRINQQVPLFLFTFLLRRERLTPRSLRLLIVHAWDRINNKHNPNWAKDEDVSLDSYLSTGLLHDGANQKNVDSERVYPVLSFTTVVVIMVRLLRHARLLWPAALVNIVAMITAPNVARVQGSTPKAHGRINFTFNRLLSLLALPSSQHPMCSVPYHQKAQFNLVRKMSEFNPPLVVSREGYRAVARVQLAHRKTEPEREWAQMKSESWPPWKEDRLGIDVDIGPEFGVSRAREVLTRAKEAGYAPQNWENAASILAGWDTDQSPTIQTRAIHGYHRPGALHNRPSQFIWAARIKATRTVEEAWACFLASQSEVAPGDGDVLHAMYEKLVFNQNRIQKARVFPNGCEGVSAKANADRHEPRALPGDGKEVAAAPKNPQHRIYIKSRPPNADGLFNIMLQAGIRPHRRCLATLLAHAENLGMGLTYLRSSTLPPLVKSILLGGYRAEGELNKILLTIPDYLFAAYIKLLSRFPCTDFRDFSDHAGIRDEARSNIQRKPLPCLNAAMQAYELVVRHRRPMYLPPWYSLMSALIRPNKPRSMRLNGESTATIDMNQWQSLLALLDEMKSIGLILDLEGFNLVCQSAQKAILAAQRVFAELERPSETEGKGSRSRVTIWKHYEREAGSVLRDAPEVVKSIFHTVIGARHNGYLVLCSTDLIDEKPMHSRGQLPVLNETPAPANLHTFIRVMGLSRQYDEIRRITQWMSDFAPELRSIVKETTGGPRKMRRVIVAIRVFLERSWGLGTGSKDMIRLISVCGSTVDTQGWATGEPAPGHVIEDIRRIIEGVDEWGGWPTDPEVRQYCKQGRWRN